MHLINLDGALTPLPLDPTLCIGVVSYPCSQFSIYDSSEQEVFCFSYAKTRTALALASDDMLMQPVQVHTYLPVAYHLSPLLHNCILVDCSAPDPPMNGTLGNYSHTEVGATVQFWCNEGFHPPDVRDSVCSNQGMWDPLPQKHKCTLGEEISS